MSRNEGPARILDAQVTDTGTIVTLPDGREFIDVDMALDADDVQRIREGYVCIRCHEPQSVPFPEVCESTLPNGEPWCNFPIREKQAAEFAIMYKGEVKLGSRINLEDEQARLDEMAEYEARTGLILPDHIKFPQGEI